MSFEKSLNQSLLDELLIAGDSGPKFLEKSLLDEISRLNNYVLDLESYHSKLGTESDTKWMRSQMNEQIAKGNSTIMKISSLFLQFDSQVFPKEEREYCEKFLRASQTSFQLYKERYTQVLREIHQRKAEFTPNESSAEDYTPDVKIHVGEDLRSYQPIEEAHRHSEELRRSTKGSLFADIEEFKLGDESFKSSTKKVNDIEAQSDTTRDFSVRYDKEEKGKSKGKRENNGNKNKKILILSILALLIIGILIFLYENGSYMM